MKFAYHLIFISIIIFSVAFLGFFLYADIPGKNFSFFSDNVCGDRTIYDKCSSDKPYFCSEGLLFERASVCGCPEGVIENGDKCLSEFQKNPNEISLKYTLRGKDKEIKYIVYEEMTNYLSSLPKSIRFNEGEDAPSRLDFKLKNIDDEEQRHLLLPLAKEIQNIAPDDEIEQVRIAVSLVQNIEWGWSDKTLNFGGLKLNYSRYPYEVLFDKQGICGEKTELMAFLLRELGFGVAFFYNQQENHESIGIKCPIEESWYQSGYCFVETSGPAIITDTGIRYVGGLTLRSEPEVFVISEGKSLPGNLYEYKNAKDFMNIRNDLKYGKIYNPFKIIKYSSLNEKYGLAETYNLD